MAYRQFAYVYDHLMQDAPYEKWLELMRKHKLHNQPSLHSILDLGCGTGAITISLSKQGYDVIGVDLSADMLSIAAEKSREEGLQVQWLEQDMRELEIMSEVDAVVCFCDSLNYITTKQDVQAVFQSVYNSLKENGYFLFDVHSLYKMQDIFAGETFASTEDDISLIWHSFWEEKERIVEHQLTFFVQEPSGLYTRFDEIHVQKGYEIEELSSWLEAAGFEVRRISADFGNGAPTEQSERIFFSAQKKNRGESSSG